MYTDRRSRYCNNKIRSYILYCVLHLGGGSTHAANGALSLFVGVFDLLEQQRFTFGINPALVVAEYRLVVRDHAINRFELAQCVGCGRKEGSDGTCKVGGRELAHDISLGGGACLKLERVFEHRARRGQLSDDGWLCFFCLRSFKGFGELDKRPRYTVCGGLGGFHGGRCQVDKLGRPDFGGLDKLINNRGWRVLWRVLVRLLRVLNVLLECALG